MMKIKFIKVDFTEHLQECKCVYFTVFSILESSRRS